MTQEQRELLLKDLCGRLYYGIFVKENRESLDDEPTIYTFDYHPCIDACKSYLRPMESMTDEESVEYNNTKTCHIGRDNCTYTHPTLKTLDWLNKKGFDYRGLIPMGLAIKALEGMYN